MFRKVNDFFYLKILISIKFILLQVVLLILFLDSYGTHWLHFLGQNLTKRQRIWLKQQMVSISLSWMQTLFAKNHWLAS